MAGVAEVVHKSLNIYGNYQSEPDITECAIFQLQTIDVDGIRLNLFSIVVVRTWLSRNLH